MKRLLGVVLAVCLMGGVAAPCVAAKLHAGKAVDQKYDRIVAEVVSLDVAAKTIVVKEEKSSTERTIKISAKAASQLQVGDRVRIKLKAGTDESAGVRVLKALPVPELESSTVTAAEPVK